MANAIFQYPVDNIAGVVTPTVYSGAEDSDYPAANLVDGTARPAKLTGFTGSWRWDFTTARRIDLVMIGRNNLFPGTDIYLEGSTSPTDWSFPFQQVIHIPDLPLDFIPYRPFADLTTHGSYTQTGYRYWRLRVATTNEDPISISDVWLVSIKRHLTTNYRIEPEWEPDYGLVEHELEFGEPLVYDLGVRRRMWRGQWLINDPTLTELTTWYASMKRAARSGLWIPDPAVNDAWLVRVAEIPKVKPLFPGTYETGLVLREDPQRTFG